MFRGDIAVARPIAGGGHNPPPQRKEPLASATKLAFKNCAPLKDCRTKINDTFVDYADFINIAMYMYNLTEYSDNYSDSSGSLWSFKRDDRANNANVTNDDNAPSFKYKSSLIINTEADGTRERERERARERKKERERVKIAVSLKYLSNLWRSL